MTVPGHPAFRIDDPADPRLDDYRFTRDRDLSGAREREGLLIAETLPVIAVLLEHHPDHRTNQINPHPKDRETVRSLAESQ